jgi:putative sigma-54 modulation protein
MMDIQLTGQHLDLTPAIKQHTDDKFKRLEHHFSHINKINIVFTIEKARHIAKATLLFDGSEINATAEANDLYVAIDILADKLERQITTHKEKLKAHRE